MKLPKNVKDISGLRVGRLVVREFHICRITKIYGFVIVIVEAGQSLNTAML